MLCREIMAVCSEIHTKQINKLCGQNVELLNVKLAVHIVTTVLRCRLERPTVGRQCSTYGQQRVIRGFIVKGEIFWDVTP
jgi:hypothetical protein